MKTYFWMQVEGAKESSPNKESEKQTKSGMGSSFRMEKNDKKTFLICGEAVQMEDVSQLKPQLPSKSVSPTVSPDPAAQWPNPTLCHCVQ